MQKAAENLSQIPADSVPETRSRLRRSSDERVTYLTCLVADFFFSVFTSLIIIPF